jgi:hypothetical protein
MGRVVRGASFDGASGPGTLFPTLRALECATKKVKGTKALFYIPVVIVIIPKELHKTQIKKATVFAVHLKSD